MWLLYYNYHKKVSKVILGSCMSCMYIFLANVGYPGLILLQPWVEPRHLRDQVRHQCVYNVIQLSVSDTLFLCLSISIWLSFFTLSPSLFISLSLYLYFSIPYLSLGLSVFLFLFLSVNLYCFLPYHTHSSRGYWPDWSRWGRGCAWAGWSRRRTADCCPAAAFPATPGGWTCQPRSSWSCYDPGTGTSSRAGSGTRDPPTCEYCCVPGVAVPIWAVEFIRNLTIILYNN